MKRQSSQQTISGFFKRRDDKQVPDNGVDLSVEPQLTAGETSSKRNRIDNPTVCAADFQQNFASTSSLPGNNSSAGDFGEYLKVKSFNDEQKLYLLTQHWRPPLHYHFPGTKLHNKQRKFQASWLELHQWLVYSPSLDGALCKQCILFATGDHLGKLVKVPLRNWNKASDEFKKHGVLGYHQDALMKAENFLHNMKKPLSTISCQLNEKIAKQIETNRLILSSIFKTVLLCGRQGIALRGHVDDGVLQPNNTSNFNNLLAFRIDSGDEILKQHLNNCDENATYVSKTSQNTMINIIGEKIRDKLLSEVKLARYFTILADEVNDASNWEQLSIVLRFVDAKNDIREEFMAFQQCENITGETVANNIIQSLNDWGLDVGNVRGQGYDGAANMAGKIKGVQARIRELNQKALYFHCASHCLSLCIVKSCSVQTVSNMLAVLRDLALFFSLSAKRQRKLEEVITVAIPDTKKHKLIDLCRTRWVEKHTALETFSFLYKVVYDRLGQIMEGRESWDSETVTKASGYLHAITDGSFLVAFVVTRKCLQYLKPITVKLQKKARDIVSAYKEITALNTCINDLRTSVDVAFAAWFMEANNMSRDTLQEDIQLPRLVGRQTHRDNPPAANAEEYYRRAITVPFLDYLLKELKDRFNNTIAVDGLTIVPESIVHNPSGFLPLPKSVHDLSTLWVEDLPEIDSLETEFNRWATKWHQEFLNGPGVPATALDALKVCDPEFFPNISQLLKLLNTLAITTSECERTISRLRTLKTYLRSTMMEDRLNGLALMRIHRDMNVDISECVNTFAVRHKTRMALLPQRLLNM